MSEKAHTPTQFVSDGPLQLVEPSSYGDRSGIVIRDRVGILAFIATDLSGSPRAAEYNANRVAFAHHVFRARNSHEQLVEALKAADQKLALDDHQFASERDRCNVVRNVIRAALLSAGGK